MIKKCFTGSLKHFSFFIIAAFILAIGLFSCSKNSSPRQVAAPLIASFTPNSGKVGDTVTINGSNFSTTVSDDIVKFNTSIVARVIFASSTQLKVIVPNGIEGISVKISVDISGQVALSNTDFTTSQSNSQLLLGKWIYSTSLTVDSFDTYTGYSNRYLILTNPAQFFYIDFIDSSKVLYHGSAFGIGESGAFYNDSISYNVSENNVYLSFPSGDSYWGDVTFTNYPAYTDTIGIISISADSLIITKNYHFQHFALYNGEYKRSIDTLIK